MPPLLSGPAAGRGERDSAGGFNEACHEGISTGEKGKEKKNSRLQPPVSDWRPECRNKGAVKGDR